MFISKRVKFHTGKQRLFLLDVKKHLNLSDKELTKRLRISTRTFTDWKREKFSVSLQAVQALSRFAHRQLPKNITIEEPFWYVRKGAKLGGITTYKRYGRVGGDEKKRKEAWQKWWEKEGKFLIRKTISKRKGIDKPKKSSELAEFMGIMLGDGGISKTQVIITLNSDSDRAYSIYVRDLLKRLFNVEPSIYKKKSSRALDIVISRKNLVDYCQLIGLKVGNKIKQGADIPDWVKRNKKFQISCMRGLIDTDGTIITHRYKSKGKLYSYKKVTFTNFSKPLIMSTISILKNLSLNPRIARENNIWLDSIQDVKYYFKIIGSHNPKHLNKYKN